MRPTIAWALAAIAICVVLGCASATTADANTSQAGPRVANEAVEPPPATGPKPGAEPPKAEAQQVKQDEYPYVQGRVYQLKDLARTTVTIEKHKWNVWIMDSNGKRMEGMMRLNGPDIKDDDGMIFVFPDEDYRGFWMKNTNIPLDIAFISSDLRIINVATMKPHDENTTPSTRPAMYVLEVKGGQFKKYGIKAGMKVQFGKKLEAID